MFTKRRKESSHIQYIAFIQPLGMKKQFPPTIFFSRNHKVWWKETQQLDFSLNV